VAELCHHVVQGDPCSDVDAFPCAVLQGIYKRDRPHEVRSELLAEESTLVQRLIYQLKMKLLEIPEAAMNQFRRATRRSRGEVSLLEQGNGQAARSGIEGATDTGDTATNHDHIEIASVEHIECLLSVRGAEGSVTRWHDSRLPASGGGVSRSGTLRV